MQSVPSTRVFLIHDVAVAINSALRKRWILAAIVVLVCGAVSVQTARHVRPFVDDVTAATSGGDDWFTYKQNALDILSHGWTMPSVSEAYYQPSGFLYNYFVAAVFAVAGPIPAYVYVVQGGLLAVAVVLYFAIGRQVLSPELSLLYPLAVGFLLYRTVYPDLTFRLLSENLVIPLIPAAVLMFLAASRAQSLSRFAAAGLMVGLVVLTRPHMQAITFLLAGLVWLYGTAPAGRKAGNAAVLMLVAIAVLSSIAVRNAAVTGQLTFTSARHAQLLPAAAQYGGAVGLLQLFVKRALYCAGVLVGGLMMTGSRISVSLWLAAPTALAVVAIARDARDRHLPLIDAVALAWLVAAYIPFIVLPLLGGYGMRFQWPTAPLLVLLACRAIDPLFRRDAGRAPAPVGNA
jgi:hypothetical protein